MSDVPLPPEQPVPTTSRRRTRRALCIGIDTYQEKPLRACVNDALLWRATLRKLGFSVSLLTDAKATKKGVLRALRKLITSARPGDSLVFHYSGHGSQVLDLSGDEGDFKDEALLPFDYHAGQIITDDDLGTEFDKVAAGVRLTCFMDCCHSGTNTRFAPTGKAAERFLPLSRDVVEQFKAVRAAEAAETSSEAPTQKAGVREILFAACLPHQKAVEADGQGHFSRRACALLPGAAGKWTHAEFLAALQLDFPLPKERQLPQLNCQAVHREEILLG